MDILREYAGDYCSTNGFDLRLLKGRYARLDGELVGGYVTYEPRRCVVAMGGALANQTLVHELGHVAQIVEDHYSFFLDKPYDVLGIKLMSKQQLRSFMLRTLVCEVDCEKRAVKLIEKLGLDIDTVEYTRNANMYLLSHKVIWQTGRWFARSPYKYKVLREIVPNEFLEDYWGADDHIYDEIRRLCFNHKT